MQAARLLIRVLNHLRFQVWVPRPLIVVRTHPGALGLCAQAAGSLQDSWERARLGCVSSQVLVWTRGA